MDTPEGLVQQPGQLLRANELVAHGKGIGLLRGSKVNGLSPRLELGHVHPGTGGSVMAGGSEWES